MTLPAPKHLPAYFITSILLLGLIGCDSGSDTITNPDTSTDSDDYTGPAPATDEVRDFQLSVWENLRPQNRCGQCHGSGQQPEFVIGSNVNTAYSAVLPFIDFDDPANSPLVTKVGGGHNCWLASDVACADNVEQMIINWSGSGSVLTARMIQLTAPEIKNPGDSKTFPASELDNPGSSFSETIHPLLVAHCQDCHEETALLPISPFFANADPASAYEAAKSKLNIDDPQGSRFVIRLREQFHNCWTSNCEDDADAMEDEITQFADAIVPIAIEASLVTSKALNLTDGIIATGGNRHESDLIALWEFKTGNGLKAFDTSGIEPTVNLDLSGSVGWLGGYGIDITGGAARADTIASKKIHDFIRSTGEYSIEAWIVPANVTQEDANIISYSAGSNSRNFTLGQRLYNYELYNRSNLSDANGEEFLSSEDAGEVLQSSLQHVVASYDPIDGRSIYVNGEKLDINDPLTESTSIADWDDTYAIVFGNEVSNDRSWSGKLRMVAMHNKVLTDNQVQQNFSVGVGEKYFLLFSVAEETGVDESFIMFEVSQFDSYSYLFDKPVFINLDPDWVPQSIAIKGLRVGINGREAFAGQAFANLDTQVDPAEYDSLNGQLLSRLGAVIALEKGSEDDEFFLTFEALGSSTNVFTDPIPSVPQDPPDAGVVSDIGVKTFEEINASISAITTIPVNNAAVDAIYDGYRQQLPTIEKIDAFLASHQIAVAQLALISCSELVESDQLLASNDSGRFFSDFDFNATALNAFDSQTKRDQIINPLLVSVLNTDLITPANNLTSQPDPAGIGEMLAGTATQDLDADLTDDSYQSLITEMTACGAGCDNTVRTEQIVKAVCAAVVGGAVMLVQ